jgi:hypothetical protein
MNIQIKNVNSMIKKKSNNTKWSPATTQKNGGKTCKAVRAGENKNK